jgi:hypothetical protein
MAYPAKLGTINLANNNEAVSLGDVSGMTAGVHGVQIPAWGTGGTVSFECTIDGTNWVALLATPTSSTTQVSSATAAGLWWFDGTALANVRLRVSATGTGSIDIYRLTRVG